MKNEKLEQATDEEIFDYVVRNLGLLGFSMTGVLFEKIETKLIFEGDIISNRLVSRSDADALNENLFFDCSFYLDKSDALGYRLPKAFKNAKQLINDLYDYYDKIEVRNTYENVTIFNIHHTNYEIDSIKVENQSSNCFVGENSNNDDVQRIYHAMLKLMQEITKITIELFRKRKSLQSNNLNYEPNHVYVSNIG